MQPRKVPRVFRRKLKPVLVAVDGLVLGAMIGKHALDVFHTPDQPYIKDEYHHTHQAINDVPCKGVGFVFTDQHIGCQSRQEDKQAHS